MRIALLLPACCLLLPCAHAQQVNRCTDTQGRTVYSDKSCEALGAQVRLPPGARPDGGSGLYRDTCARRLSEVVGQIRSAMETRDANRLSGIYAWSGLSTAAATHVMDRLDAIVRRPLVDIAPVYPGDALLEPADAADPDAPQGPIVITNMPATRPRPVALRLEQTLANGSTPSRTLLRLRRQYNCFWISL